MSAPRGKKPSVFICGTGRLGPVLARAIAAEGWPVLGLWGRRITSVRRASRLVPKTPCFSNSIPQKLAEADLVLLAVSDDALVELSQRLGASGFLRRGQVLAHTSGALPGEVLAPKPGVARGSFHPLLSIAGEGGKLAGAFFGVEGEPRAVRLLARLARALGGKPILLSAQSKVLYHAACVLASNALIALEDAACSLFKQAIGGEDEGLPALLPLIRSTVANIGRLGLAPALTGPVARGDKKTIRGHVEALHRAAPDEAEIYRLLSLRLVHLARRQGRLDPKTATEIERLLAPKSQHR